MAVLGNPRWAPAGRAGRVVPGETELRDFEGDQGVKIRFPEEFFGEVGELSSVWTWLRCE